MRECGLSNFFTPLKGNLILRLQLFSHAGLILVNAFEAFTATRYWQTRRR
jgi:hypothetical protein